MNMANPENKSEFSLVRFSKNILVGSVLAFCYGFSVGVGEDNSYHFAVIVGGHTMLAGLVTHLIFNSINSSNLLESLPRLKTILNCCVASLSFYGMNSFIVNASPYTKNSEIMNNTVGMGNITIGALFKYAIVGALAGYILSSSLFAYKKKYKAK
jgi:hypothetical protein